MIDKLAETLKEAVEDYCLEHCCITDDYPFKCFHLEQGFTSQPCKAQKWLEVLDEFYQQAAEEKKNDV
jgi:hypothetical protein